MKLLDAEDDFLNALRFEQGLSVNTIDSYRPRLRAFLRWLKEETGEEPTSAHLITPTLRRYVYYRCEQGDRPRTVRACFDAIRSFCRHLQEAGVLSDNPTKTLTLPKMDAAVLEVTTADVKALLDACEKQRTPRLIAFSRAVLSVLCFGGLRRDELCNLRTEDYSVSDGALLIRSGKGAKSRKVYLCEEGGEALQAWLAIREKTDCEYLFTIYVGRRVYHTAGLRDNGAVKPHGLRHWAATNLLRNGATLRDVQASLGHANISITSRYLHTDEERLRTISELTAIKREPEEGGKVLRSPQRQEQERPRIRRMAR